MAEASQAGHSGVEERVLELENVSFSYDGRLPVLENVTLSIVERDFVSVIGPNGGGKTTLLKLILGLLEPGEGEVRVLGTTPIRARPRIGYMPQLAAMDPQFPVQVLDVVLMGRLGVRPGASRLGKNDRVAASVALNRVGLGGLETRPFSQLSGGQRQRVLLARALASDPALVLLDEPAANLDQKVERDFFELLRELNRDSTVVLVSHDLGFVRSFVRTVVCVHKRVHVHPTSALDGEAIHRLYDGEVRVVHHDQRL
jgi:zinc transport system ATP-binding protein